MVVAQSSKTKFSYVVLFLVVFAITSCDSAESRAKKIISLRAERAQMIVNLYQEYGGSDLSNSINANLQNDQGASSTPVVQGLANLTQGVDRSVFEQTLRAVGRGEQHILVTEKAKQFFSRQDVVKQAQKISEIELELAELESRQNR